MPAITAASAEQKPRAEGKGSIILVGNGKTILTPGAGPKGERHPSAIWVADRNMFGQDRIEAVTLAAGNGGSASGHQGQGEEDGGSSQSRKIIPFVLCSCGDDRTNSDVAETLRNIGIVSVSEVSSRALDLLAMEPEKVPLVIVDKSSGGGDLPAFIAKVRETNPLAKVLFIGEGGIEGTDFCLPAGLSGQSLEGSLRDVLVNGGLTPDVSAYVKIQKSAPQPSADWDKSNTNPLARLMNEEMRSGELEDLRWTRRTTSITGPQLPAVAVTPTSTMEEAQTEPTRAEEPEVDEVEMPRIIVASRLTPAVERLITKVNVLKRNEEQGESLGIESREDYDNLTPEEQVCFIAWLYDIFSETYDEHMEITGHFNGIRMALDHAAPYLRYPIIDLTAGTCEPLLHAIGLMDNAILLRLLAENYQRGEIDLEVPPESRFLLMQRDPDIMATRLRILLNHLPPEHYEFDENNRYWVYANDLSQKMLAIGQKKFGDHYRRVNFTNYDAFQISKISPRLRGRFNTVLCSQTFHLIPKEEKLRMVKSIASVLAINGIAIVIEEDPFKVSPTAPIARVRQLIQTISQPITNRGTLVGYFESNGFVHLKSGAKWDIDPSHFMRAHVFRKVPPKQKSGSQGAAEEAEEDGDE